MSRTSIIGISKATSAVIVPSPEATVSVRLLTAYASIVLLVPAWLVFAPLGQVGTLAIGFASCLLMWFIASWISGRVVPSGAGRPIRVAMTIFSLAILASFVAAMTREISQSEMLAATSGLIWLATSFGVVAVASQCVTDYNQLDRLMRRIVIIGCITAVIGMAQFFRVDLTHYMVIPGLSVSTSATSEVLTRGGFIRPWGNTLEPIELSVVLAMLLPFAIQQAFDPARKGWWRKWVPVALLAFTNFLTVSRSGVIGLAIVFVCLLPTWKPRRRWGALGVIVVGLGLTHLTIHGLITSLVKSFEGLINSSDQNVQQRTANYAGVSSYIAQRPWFGRGYGTFLPLVYRFTDNMYLLGIVEFGIVGLFAMLLVFVSGMRCAVVGRRLTRDEPRRELGQAFLAAIVVATVTSATFDSFSFPVFSGLFFVILGCAGAYLGIITAEARGENTRHIPAPGHRLRSELRKTDTLEKAGSKKKG